MKILLFNLGPIEHRIIGWDIEGFKSLLSQDIILWGPIPDDKFIYENKEIPILRISEPTTIRELFSKLPDGWVPDIVTCETSVLNYIPDIYLCPVRTVLFTRDAWSDTIFNRKLVQFFDFLNHAAIDRSEYNALNVNLLPLSNSAVSLPGQYAGNTVFKDRDIDVIAIANCDGSFYHERYKAFYRLSHANRSGIKIRFLRGVKRADISSYYQHSKIMLDWAHTLSNRSYEAALNGCLLFSHTDNTLIKEFWTPWEEYIPYDNNTILDLIKFYLNNPDKAQKIIDKAKEKSKSIASSWGDYVLDNVNKAYSTEIPIDERIKRFESMPLSGLHYCTATPFLYNYDYNTSFPRNWKKIYFERIDAALIHARDPNEKIAPLIEAARLSFLIRETDRSQKYLDELKKIVPDYAWTYYLQGRIYFQQGKYDKALQSLIRSLECGKNAPGLLQQYVLPAIEHGNPCDGRRITDFMWQSVYNHKNEYQVNALMYLVHELSGEVYLKTDNKLKAKTSFIEATDYVPISVCLYKACDLLMESREFARINEIAGKGIENSPYDSILVFYKAYALIQLKERRSAYTLLNEHRLALKSFLGARKIVIIRYTINFILFLMLFGKQPDLIIIIKMIDSLKKKSGTYYLAT